MFGLTGRRQRLRGGCVWLGLTWALAGTGCADSQVRSLVRQGDVAGAQAVAAQTKRPLGGRAARALGDRLATMGEYEDARALLAASQARGGASETLRSLAEVEAAMGLDGAAAQRFYLLARRGPRRATESPRDVRSSWSGRGCGRCSGRRWPPTRISRPRSCSRGAHGRAHDRGCPGAATHHSDRGGGGTRRASTAAAVRGGCM